MNDKKTFVNTLMNDTEVSMLDWMVKEDDSDRSKTIRRLIKQEYLRRVSVTPTAILTGHGDELKAFVPEGQ